MLKQPNLSDDLFEKSSMSFGEHLEELRKALVKAFLWLALGTGIGLFVANEVVKFIEQPLRSKLDDFYIEQTKVRFKSINNVDPPEKLLHWMKDHSMMPEQVFLDPTQLAAEAEELGSETVGSETVGSERPGSRAAGSAGQDAAAAGVDSPRSDTSADASADTVRSHEKPAGEEQGAEEQGAEDRARSITTHDAVWNQLSGDSIERLRPLLIMRPIPNRLMTFSMLEGFMIWLKAGLLVGAVIASPGIFYHIWEFLAAGLYPHERRYVYLYLPLSVLLFVAGVSLAFFVIFQLVIEFLLTYNVGMDIDFAPRLTDYISFALFLPLGFGAAFQLPIVMLGLNRFGIVSTELYVSKWRIAILGIAFLSMVLTPADAYSMIGMFVPLTLLYFLGIALCKFMPKGPGLGSQAFDPA